MPFGGFIYCIYSCAFSNLRWTWRNTWKRRQRVNYKGNTTIMCVFENVYEDVDFNWTLSRQVIGFSDVRHDMFIYMLWSCDLFRKALTFLRIQIYLHFRCRCLCRCPVVRSLFLLSGCCCCCNQQKCIVLFVRVCLFVWYIHIRIITKPLLRACFVI